MKSPSLLTPSVRKTLAISNIAIGVAGVVLVAIVALLDQFAFDRLLDVSTGFNSTLYFGIALVITGIACNFMLFAISPNIYSTLSMLVYQAAFLIFPAAPAALIVAIPALVVELFQLNRGVLMAVRTTGMYMLATVAAAFAFNTLGGGPITGDLSLKYLLAVIAGFFAFRIVNETVISLTQYLQGEGFWESLRLRVAHTTTTYVAMLPGSIILAILCFQSGLASFVLACGLATGIGLILKRLSDLRRDELKRLQEMEKLNEQLARQNNRQQELSNRINTTMESFLNLLRDYSGISQEQEVAVVQITATVEELSHTAGQIANSSDIVAEAADRAIETTRAGQSAVLATIDAINEARQKMQEIYSRIEDLNQKSDQIGEILTTINAIANEIRLLALNATIEASGAGPYGKRFAVVAGEVNELADRSRQAALEIRRIIAEIQSATTSTVRVTGEGMQKMERSVNTAQESEAANTEIISQVESTARSAAAISLATQQQRSASEQVVTNMHNVAIMIGQNAEKVASVSVASLELQRAVRELLSED